MSRGLISTRQGNFNLNDGCTGRGRRLTGTLACVVVLGSPGPRAAWHTTPQARLSPFADRGRGGGLLYLNISANACTAWADARADRTDSTDDQYYDRNHRRRDETQSSHISEGSRETASDCNSELAPPMRRGRAALMAPPAHVFGPCPCQASRALQPCETLAGRSLLSSTILYYLSEPCRVSHSIRGCP